STPDGLARMNPPLLRFGFATPDKEFDPGEITVKLNGNDVSDQIRYSVYYHQGRKANFCLATWMPDMYLNPQSRHSFDIQINPEKGGQLEKRLSFGVQDVDPPKIIHAGFKPDDTMRFFHHNKMMVLTMMSPNVKIRDILLNPNKWAINYSDLGVTPPISSIERIKDRMYSITFNNDFEVGKMVKASFTPTDGVTTKEVEFQVPQREISRGGSMSRKLASMIPCVTCQKDAQGNPYKFTDWITDSADECEDLHHIHVGTNCPPQNCDPMLQETITHTTYSFAKNIFVHDSDNGVPLNYTIPPATVWPCYDINQIYYFSEDIHVIFDMLAMEDPNQQEYCLVDKTPVLQVLSDTTVPTFAELATVFTIDEKCPWPSWPPCTDCEKYFQYYLTVKASDNNCVLPIPRFLVFYNNGEQFDMTPSFNYVPDASQIIEPYMFEKKYMVDPHLFACAQKLKIIVYDKKGNWNSLYRYPIPAGSTTYTETGSPYLPFPDKVELKFDSRLPSGDNIKQYVNLNRQFENEIDQEVCTVRLIDDSQLDLAVNHGSLIYMEVSAVPPLPAINLHVEYIDPVNVYPSATPTNTRKGTINQSTGCVVFDPNSGSDYSESANGNLTIDGYHKLWSKHEPYAGDYRTLGDNWNYHIDYEGQIEEYDVPLCDPIRTHTPDPPCFWNCTPPPGEYCLDQICQKGRMTCLKTNKHGKYGVYFDTKSFGGDNFQFRAYAPGYYVATTSDCLESVANTKFTVWRKIYVDYAWMDDRNGQYTEDYPCVVKDGD
ncbi:MAG: hypothetical protein ABIG42_10730, partial [bacterium]